jgi:hypothetical protein
VTCEDAGADTNELWLYALFEANQVAEQSAGGRSLGLCTA